jgi:hypothetical protein
MTGYAPEDPLRFWLGTDATPEESRHHGERMLQIARVLMGLDGVESIPDLLLSQGENPDQWIDQAIHNLEKALLLPPDRAELLLWPQSDPD